MKSCPQCGKSENEISMTTNAESADKNVAWCPCGFTGKYGDLKGESEAVKKVEPPKEPPADQIPEDSAETPADTESAVPASKKSGKK